MPSAPTTAAGSLGRKPSKAWRGQARAMHFRNDTRQGAARLRHACAARERLGAGKPFQRRPGLLLPLAAGFGGGDGCGAPSHPSRRQCGRLDPAFQRVRDVQPRPSKHQRTRHFSRTMQGSATRWTPGSCNLCGRMARSPLSKASAFSAKRATMPMGRSNSSAGTARSMMAPHRAR